MNNLLFIYGTLLLADNQVGAYLRTNCEFVTQGKVKGLLYDLGEYPGLIPSAANEYVHGSVYRMVNAAQVLAQLDYYEGTGPDEEQPNLYCREEVVVITGAGTLKAWIYIYNRPVLAHQLIRSGDYLKYTGKKNPPALKNRGI